MIKQKNNNSASDGKLIQRVPIEGTPFIAVKYDEEPAFLTWGKFRLPYTANSLEEMIKIIDQEKWNIITLIAGIIAEETYKIMKEENN
jgi:hypothetical protein